MMELINGQQGIVEAIVLHLFQCITQGSMGTNQNLCMTLMKEFDEAFLLVLLILDIGQVIMRRYNPIGKEAMGFQTGVPKLTSDALFRHGHYHTFQTLMR